MRIAGLIWLETVVDKLEAKHSVSAEEVEQLFAATRSLRVRRMSRGRFRNEDVYRALGRTEAGRLRVAFFIYEKSGEALILSARDMDAKERSSYGR